MVFFDPPALAEIMVNISGNMKKKGTLEIVIIVCGTDLLMSPHKYMVDIAVKDWYSFYKLFLIMCHDGLLRLVKLLV